MSEDFDPKIIGSVFFFAPQSAVVENIVPDVKYVFHYIVEDSYRLNSIPVHHDGFGSKEKNGSKRNSPKPAPSANRRWYVE